MQLLDRWGVSVNGTRVATCGADWFGLVRREGREREESDADEEIAKQESLKGKEVAP